MSTETQLIKISPAYFLSEQRHSLNAKQEWVLSSYAFPHEMQNSTPISLLALKIDNYP